MILTAALTALTVALSAFVHYEVLATCNEGLDKLDRITGRAKVLLAIGAAFCSHLAHISIFAAAYWLFQDTTMGGLRGQFHASAASFLYFSAETYTSLGFGDVLPVGEVRLIAGMEALTGLLMISWTASFTYLEMRRHWRVRGR